MSQRLTINIGTKKSPDHILNLNNTLIHKTILPLLQIEYPNLKLKDLRYYNNGKRQWCLYLHGKLWLRYDKQHHHLSIHETFKDYVNCVRDVVRYHLTHSILAIHKFKGFVQNVYHIGKQPVRVIEIDYNDNLHPGLIAELPVESLPKNVVGKDIRKYIKECPF